MIDFKLTQVAKRNSISIEQVVGDIRFFAQEENKESLKEQFNKNYSYGGGWNPFKGFVFDKESKTITYPEDPPLKPLAEADFRDQKIYIYPYSWVLILEKDGSFEVSRMD